MMKATKETIRHKLGHQELKNRPTQEELEAFYQSEYFDSKNFERSYCTEEKIHKDANFIEALLISGKKNGFFLDIGCGEGFSLNYFSNQGWNVVGLDYSDAGVKRHFPDQLKNLRVGDIYQKLNHIETNTKEKFDIIICDNVLEHLLDPIDFVKRFKSLLTKDGVVRIQAPNDFSFLQKEAVKRGHAPDKFWVDSKQHMSYFTQDSLKHLAEYCGLKVIDLLGDFPIDFFLFNPDTNYLKDSSKGKNCHFSRIFLDNMILKDSPEKFVAFRRGCGQAGLGRNAIIYMGLH